MLISFVLLSSAVAPDKNAIKASYARLFPDSDPLEGSVDGTGITTFTRSDGTPGMVAMVPTPVPNGEADEAARFSLGGFSRDGFHLEPHVAHFVVSSSVGPKGEFCIESLTKHTELVAAVADAHAAVGVYEGRAKATHPTGFYVEGAASTDFPLMLWTGVSIARPSPETTEILTLGLTQLHVPDILVAAPSTMANSALEFLFDIATYVVRRGRPIAEGDTVGPSAEEKIPVHYVPSPLGGSETVARIELRAS